LFGYIGIVVAAALANVIGGIAAAFAVRKTELLSLGWHVPVTQKRPA
jgi:hypothetical protein